MRLGRRAFLRGAIGGLGLAAAGCAAARGPKRPVAATYFVPGYAPERAYSRGRPVAEDPVLGVAVPPGWDGRLTLVTRVDERAGTLRRAVLPLAGHEITLSPDGRRAVFNSLNDPHCVSFDPATLEEAALRPHGEGFIGAGHAFYLPDGPLVIAERRAWSAYQGRPEAHHGRIAVRDPESFALLESFSCHGMAPHEIGLLADGRHVAVANYGKALWPDGTWRKGLLKRVAPSLTVIDLADGRLVHEVRNADPELEVRHLAAHSLDRLFAISARMEGFAEAQDAMRGWDEGVYEVDTYSGGGTEVGYLPAPLLRYALGESGGRVHESWTPNELLMRYGQSLVYDATHDEVLATYPTRHAVLVFAGGDGRLRRVLRTDRLGLRHPRGIVLHPDGRHYAVSGFWQDVRVFERGRHAPAPARDQHAVWFGHSHLAVTAAS